MTSTGPARRYSLARSEASDITIVGRGPAELRHATYQDRPFECTKDGCQHRFKTEKDMKRHKKYDPDHFYCMKCNVDCEDWEALTQHKVERMAPFLDGTYTPREGEMPEHIVCEFCGADFKSFGGRKAHRSQAHAAEQDLTCPGCACHFTKAFLLVSHLEKGNCSAISASQFFSSMQHKYINAQIMQRPDKFNEMVEKNIRPPCGELERITDGSEAVDQDAGGVLLDQMDAETGGYPALQPESNLMSFPDEEADAFPLLPSKNGTEQPTRGISGLRGSLGSLSISESVTSVSNHDNGGDSSKTASRAWKEYSSKALFPLSKAKKDAGNWKAIQRDFEGDPVADDDHSLSKALWWNPDSGEFKPEYFLNHLIGKYCCPVPVCLDENAEFDRPWELVEHFLLAHIQRVYRCPSCFKRFGSCAALIGHAESTRSCAVREHSGFKTLINEISGGFLQAKNVREKKLYKGMDLVKAGKPGGGVMSTRFSSVG